MRILLVFHGEFPWNRGIGRAASAFSHHGHEVVILARNLSQSEQNEKKPEYTITRPSSSRLKWLNRLKFNNFPLNPLMVFYIWRAARAYDVGVIVVREIHLVLASFLVAKLRGIPLCLDMKEAYPYAVEVWGKQRLYHHLSRNRFLVALLERLSVALSDHVYVVCPSQVSRLVSRYQLEPSRITIVPNTVAVEYDERARELFEERVRAMSTESGSISLVYVGNVSRYRGVEAIIAAIRARGDSAMTFTIIGRGDPDYMNELQELAGDSAHILFEKFVAPEKVAETLSRFHYGVISYEMNNHVNHSMPGKFCEYLSLGLPVISTEITDIRDYWKDYDCGLLVKDANDEGAMLSVLSDIASTPWSRYRHRVREARRLYEEKLSYELAVDGYQRPLPNR